MKFSIFKIKLKPINEVRFSVDRPWLYFFISVCAVFFVYFIVLLLLPLPKPVIPITSDVYDIEGKIITSLYLENRKPVPLSEVHPDLINAFLAIEDNRFFSHNGIDLRAVARAFLNDLFSRKPRQGGSTITQQLARNLYLSHRRTLWRKIQEAFLALQLEWHYNKQQILAMYLNQVYFGHGAYGVEVAAETYFQKPASRLALHECALLAGLVKGPSLYSPFNNSRRALLRRNLVLDKMAERGFITQAQARSAQKKPLSVQKTKRKYSAPFFIDFIKRQVAARLKNGDGLIYSGGLQIYTTLDQNWQKAAEETILRKIPISFFDAQNVPQPQAAIIAMDPRTGYIKALVGGRDFNKSNYNRAILAERQPGSAFKPFLYAAALEKGYSLASPITCQPTVFSIGNNFYRPTDGSSAPYHHKTLTLREALAVSCNVSAVKLIEGVTPREVVKTARKLGIRSQLKPNLSLALGTSEVTPLELSTAYMAFANGGYYIEPTAILKIVSPQGEILWKANPAKKRILSASTAFLVTSALKDVFSPYGTAASVGFPPFPAAGKTGTTQNNHDAWFVGYTPNFLATVYIGNDRPETGVGGSGGKIAAPAWAFFAEKVLAGKNVPDFPKPADVVSIKICMDSHRLATPACPGYEEFCAAGKFSATFCPVHQPFPFHVCARTRLLPGPHCISIVKRMYTMESLPKGTCATCRPPENFVDWLKSLFKELRKY